MYTLFCVSGTVLQYYHQSCLCFFFFKYGKRKGSKRMCFNRDTIPHIYANWYFCTFLCYLGDVCYTAGKSLPFCFFENGGTVSSLSPTEKMIQMLPSCLFRSSFKMNKIYQTLQLEKQPSGSEQTGDQREFRCFSSKISNNRHTWFKHSKIFIPFV